MAALFFFGLLVSKANAFGQVQRLPQGDSTKPFSIRVLPENFYSRHLSFVCKKELQLQKLTSLPIFIRLGSKEYVDYLERKPNAVWKPN